MSGLMKTSSSVNDLMKWGCRGHEATEVVEAVEAIEAPEVPEAREIAQCAKCKVSFPAKMHKKAKNVEKKNLKVALHLVHSNSFLQNFFFEFLHTLL